MPLYRAEAGERQVVGVHRDLLVGRARQQPPAARSRPLAVVIPGRAPAGMAQLQAVVERVARTQQPLASGLHQDRGVAGCMARGPDGTHPGPDLGAELEGVQPLTEQRDRLAGGRQVLIGGRVRFTEAPRPERDLSRMGVPVRRRKASSPGQVAPRTWS